MPYIDERIKPFGEKLLSCKPEALDLSTDKSKFIEELYSDFDVKKYFICSLTGWSFIQQTNGKFFGIAYHETQEADTEEEIISFLQSNF